MDKDGKAKKTILLHSCCGPCSTAVIERLLEDYDITVFYYNPNITDPEEYNHRLAEERRFIDEYCRNTGAVVKLIEGDYKPEEFFEAARGLEDEPEGGARCRECFRLRLKKTAELADAEGFDCFDTTLTVSPYKNYDVISELGRQLAGRAEYISGNYKKKEGYKRSIELSKEYELYRQHFCGCCFSQREANK